MSTEHRAHCGTETSAGSIDGICEDLKQFVTIWLGLWRRNGGWRPLWAVTRNPLVHPPLCTGPYCATLWCAVLFSVSVVRCSAVLFSGCVVRCSCVLLYAALYSTEHWQEQPALQEAPPSPPGFLSPGADWLISDQC